MKLLLIDGPNLVRRIYAALPEAEKARTDNANVSGIAVSCRRSIQRAVNLHQPTHCAAVFDHHGKTWRHEIFPDYKKNRPAVPPLLHQSMSSIVEVFQHLDIRCLFIHEYEADDVIATIATHLSARRGQAVILTTDRIQCQLLRNNIRIYDHFSKRFIDEQDVRKRFGVAPQRIPDVMALCGDTGISVPGVHSIGIKTASRLVQEYGDLDTILGNPDRIAGALGRKLKQDRDSAEIAFRLFSLKTDVHLGINLKELRMNRKGFPRC